MELAILAVVSSGSLMYNYFNFIFCFTGCRMFNATFNYISAISWWSILLVEDIGVTGENCRPTASHRQTISHNVVSITPFSVLFLNCIHNIMHELYFPTRIMHWEDLGLLVSMFSKTSKFESFDHKRIWCGLLWKRVMCNTLYLYVFISVLHWLKFVWINFVEKRVMSFYKLCM